MPSSVAAVPAPTTPSGASSRGNRRSIMAAAAATATIGSSHTSHDGARSSVVALRVKSCMIAAGGTYQWPLPVGECCRVPVSSDAVGSTSLPNDA